MPSRPPLPPTPTLSPPFTENCCLSASDQAGRARHRRTRLLPRPPRPEQLPARKLRGDTTLGSRISLGAWSNSASAAPQPRVKQVPHRITEHVETVNGNSQGKTGPESQPRGRLHEFAPFPAEQSSPLRSPEWQTESEEAQRSNTQDYASCAYAESDNHDRHNIGDDMSDKCFPF